MLTILTLYMLQLSEVIAAGFWEIQYLTDVLFLCFVTLTTS